MSLVDVLGVALIVAAGGSFLSGEVALARSDDIQALYWLVVGGVCVFAGVQVARPGVNS